MGEGRVRLRRRVRLERSVWMEGSDVREESAATGE